MAISIMEINLGNFYDNINSEIIKYDKFLKITS